MAETKKNNFLNLFINFLNKNLKIFIFIGILILILITISQFYLYYKNQNILKSSIAYNQTKLLDSEIDFLNKMNLISKNKNFFSVLASLEVINSHFKKDNFDDAYDAYLVLFKNENLKNSTIKTSIAISAAYRLLEKIDNLKIINLLSYLDQSLIEYNGHKLEILYLISIIEKDKKKSENLYNEITNDINISSSIKERVKSINEYKKYK